MEPGRAILRREYQDRGEYNASWKGVKRLMISMLWTALKDLKNPPSSQAYGTARAWIDANEPTYILSFYNVCLYLGLDPDYLRRGIEKLKLEGNLEKILKDEDI
jgi:hypothetical protein